MSTISEEILQELKQVSPAIAIPGRRTPYAVPSNYFDELAGNITRHVRANVAGQTLHLPADHPFTTPPGYFENLAGNIMSSIKASNSLTEVESELEEIAPLLNTISKNMVYPVPEHYFEQLVVPVQKTPAKVVSMPARKTFRYAVAAAVVGVIGVSTWFLAPVTKTPVGGSANISVTAAVKTVSDSDIVEFLNTNSFGPEVSATQKVKEADRYIDRVIQKVSDKEIEEYLNEMEEPAAGKAKES